MKRKKPTKQHNRAAPSGRNNRAMSPRRRTLIKAWAYVVRYGMPIGGFLPALIVKAFTDSRRAMFLALGAGFSFFALYYLIGYLLRWTHMYCVYQDAYHEKMTPDRVDWSKVEKKDAWGIPLIFLAFGVMFAVLAFTE